jgi:uncharacterized protein (DUF1778 family)
LKPSLKQARVEATILRMGTATKPRRSSRLTAQINWSDRQLFKLAAGLNGLSVEEFVLTTARAAAEKAVCRGRNIRLTADQSRLFVQALLAPSRPAKPRLRRALALHQATVTER